MTQSILTPPTLVTAALTAKLVQLNPELKAAFDPTLTIDESIQNARAIRSTKGHPGDEKQFPLLGWSRAQIMPMGEQTYRSTQRAMMRAKGKAGFRDVRAVNANFTFRFRLYARDILQMEQYELLYATRNFLSDVTTFDLSLPFLKDVEMPNGADTGTWPYHVQWEPLDDLLVEKTPMPSFSIGGQATINGYFLTASVEDLPLIQRIILEVGSLYDSQLFPPPETVLYAVDHSAESAPR